MLRFKGRSILLAVLLAFVVSVTGFGTAFAATSDPYMTSYELGTSGYVYTYDELEWDGTPRSADVYLMAGPSSDGETPSYFTTEADALAVEWSFIDDSSLHVVQFTETGADNWGDGWFAYAEVKILDCVTPTQFGAVSIQALNPDATDPNTGEKAYVNFTLQINEESPVTYISAANVGYIVYDPAGGFLQAYADTTSAGDFYETDLRTYPTIMDGVVEMLYSRLIGGYTYYNVPDLGDTVSSLTVNEQQYVNNDKIGWQYSVYRQVGQYYTMLPMSSVVGPDAFKLLKNDIVVWKYDSYYNLNLFPATIQSW